MLYVDIFISYSRQNPDQRDDVRNALLALGFTVWTDQEIPTGAPDWMNEIEDALQFTGAVVLLATPEANYSPNVQNEIEIALKLKIPIFPLLIDGEPDEAIPKKLVNVQYSDARGNDYASGLFRMTRSIYRNFKRQLFYHYLKETSQMMLPPEAHSRASIYKATVIAGVVELRLFATYGVFFKQELNVSYNNRQGPIGTSYSSGESLVVNMAELDSKTIDEEFPLHFDQKQVNRKLGTVIAIPIRSLLEDKVEYVLAVDSQKSLVSLKLDGRANIQNILNKGLGFAAQFTLLLALEDENIPPELFLR